MAAISWRRRGGPRRASCAPSIGIAGIVPGRSAVVARAGASALAGAAAVASRGRLPASSDSSPAKKPLSQARCSRVKGAFSGIRDCMAAARSAMIGHAAVSSSEHACSVVDVVPAAEGQERSPRRSLRFAR